MSELRSIADTLEGFAERVRSLVREELGCGCGDEVFDDIRLLAGAEAPAGSRQALAIGGRLLVVIGPGRPSARADDALVDLLRRSVEVRESLGLNRVRLVLSDAAPAELREQIDAELEGLDDRVHVHYL